MLKVRQREANGDITMIFHMPECSGCGNCSMACSFHNEGEFAPAKAAIRSLEREDGRGYLISFSEEDDKEKLLCSGCRECVKHCVPGEELEKIIKEYMEKRSETGQSG
jgi:succinate dehydrogenase/fumarate reductase-like Fe-S protein